MSRPKISTIIAITLATLTSAYTAESPLPADLILDLDAAHGVQVEDGDRVVNWVNQVPNAKARDFVSRDPGRKVPGSGRPTLKKTVAELNNKPSMVFRQQELVCMDEDTFDSLTTGAGNTWICIMSVYKQRVGLKDVNSFFGNLRNGARYEGLWGCVDDKNGLWYGGRNGLTFGRFDKNNPKLTGPRLKVGQYYLVAGRMAAGTGDVATELFVNTTTPVATAKFPVNPKANPSMMAIGQERDAIQHPGKESFDGEIARLLIWQRPLTNQEFEKTIEKLKTAYGLK